MKIASRLEPAEPLSLPPFIGLSLLILATALLMWVGAFVGARIF